MTTETTDATPNDAIEENTGGEALNDIRFEGWTKKEWADNDYIRAVRKYIDAYNRGEIKNPDLDEHKNTFRVNLQLQIYSLI